MKIYSNKDGGITLDGEMRANIHTIEGKVAVHLEIEEFNSSENAITGFNFMFHKTEELMEKAINYNPLEDKTEELQKEIEQLQQQRESDKKTIEALKNDWRELRDENNLLQKQKDELMQEFYDKYEQCIKDYEFLKDETGNTQGMYAAKGKMYAWRDAWKALNNTK